MLFRQLLHLYKLSVFQCDSVTDVGLNVEVIGKCDSCVDVLIGNDRAVQFIDIAELGEGEGVVDTYKDRVRLLTKVIKMYNNLCIILIMYNNTAKYCSFNYPVLFCAGFPQCYSSCYPSGY